jgi:hypothetical protein
MSSLKKVITLIAAFIAVTVVVVLISASSPEPTQPPWPTLKGAATPNPTDIADIKTLVNNYYYITAEAATTFDLLEFPSLFIDDPAVALDANEAAFMARVGATGTGFLSYELAFFTDWKQGTEKQERLQATAKAENRDLTRDEFNSLIGPNGLAANRNQQPVYKISITDYFYFTVDGSQALVKFDDGAVTQGMFFIKTKNGWRIAGKHVIWAHA